MTTPTHETAKLLNRILTPYLPTENICTSPVEFLDLLRTSEAGEEIASLDVENLFTNVPLEETIEIILDRVYRSHLPSLAIPEHLLKELLKACTTEAPFFTHRGDIYKQTNGVSMGSPLGVLFAEIYMAKVEERTFNATERPNLYVRFRDDIFIKVKNVGEIEALAVKLEENSVLRFTIERAETDAYPIWMYSFNKLQMGSKRAFTPKAPTQEGV